MTTPRTISTWVLGVVLVLVCSPLISNVVYTYTRAGESARVHAATASTLNFQARLMNSGGALVADGSYSIEFKLYDAASGGTNEWTETQSVTVKNGYFSSYLGTVTPFAGTIDWSQEKWLTMNVNGDGEMSPRIKLTAVPYALRSGQADSLTITGGAITGDNLLQKAPGAVQSVNSADSGLRFNQTGAGGLIQLQGDGLDVFTVSKAGDLSTAGNAAILGGTLTLGSATQASSVVLNDGTGNTATLSFGTFTGNRVYTLPNASGEICLTTTCGGGGLSFLQDGNAFSEDGVLGTTDNYALRFITNNTEKFTILANGNVGVGDTTPAALFTVGTADALQIDASGNLLTTGTITSGGLVTANGGLQINLGGVPGLLKVDASGNVGLATSGTDYEQPLTFGNGLTRTGNAVALGGALTANTTVDLGSFNLTFNNGGTLNIGTTTSPYASKLNVGGNLTTTSTNYNVFSASSTLNAYGYFRSVETSDTVSRFELGAYDVNGVSQGGRDLVLNPLGGNVGIGGDLTPDGLFSVGSTSQFQVNSTGTITGATSGNTINGLIINSGALSGISTISASGAITAATAGNTINGLIINSGALSGVTTLNMSGGITAATTNTINGLNINAGNISGLTGLTFTSGGINLNNGGITNAGALSGITTLNAGSGKFNVDANGGLTSGFTVLNGSTTATSASGLSPGTINVGSGNTANFDVGNYVLVNGTYAKITAKTASALSITPNLTWANGATVIEYYIPEIGGGNTTSTLTNRFGRGYFIAGVVTGNGTTYYNEDGIVSTLGTFNIANEGVTTLNIGGGATNIAIGASGTTVSVAGNLQTAANQTITAGGGLIVNANGIDLNSTGIFEAGAISGVTTISASGGITAATTNTINGLNINAGALSGVTGITFASGGVNLNSGGITNAGAIGGVTGLTLTSGNLALGGGNITGAGSISGTSLSVSGAITAATAGNTINGLIINAGALSGISSISASGSITAATTGTINGLSINAGAVSGVTTISASGAITAATTTNTINGLIINSGSLSSITGFSQTAGNFSVTGTGSITLGAGSNVLTINSTAFDVSSTGALSGISTISASGAITAATTGTINGLNINAGALSGITGITFTSGNLALGGGSITGVGTNITANGALTIISSGTNALTLDSGTTGTVNLGTGNNAKTLNIGTGTAGDIVNIATNNTTPDTVNLGSASDVLTISSSGFKVTSAGAVTGVTTLAASGQISTTTGVTVNSLAGVNVATCGATQYLGGIRVTGGVITAADTCRGVGLSDQTLKTNITALDDSVLDEIKNIQTVTFDFDCTNTYFSSTNTYCDPKTQTGVLAQQLETVLPGLVYADEHGIKHVNYEGLSIYALKGVGELSKYLNSQGNASLNNLSTGGTLRLTASGALQNINGLNLSSGGASIVGGLNNNGSGITAAGAITGVTTIGAQAITLDADSSSNLLTLKKDGNGVFTVFNTGALELKLDSANAFAVKGANGDNALNVDTLTGKVKIGAGNNGKTVLFVLDTKSSDGDPAGVNGAQYYNSSMKKFRCYQNDKWQDCLQTAFSEYTIASGGGPWTQPSGDHELPGENRTWIDLGNANQARLLINVSTAGNQGASCRLQYSLTEDNPTWHDLTDSGSTTIDRTGAVKGDWLQIKNDAKGEVLVRVYCSGGDNTSIINYSSIRTQIR